MDEATSAAWTGLDGNTRMTLATGMKLPAGTLELATDTGANYDAVMAKHAAQNVRGPSISAPKFPRPPSEMLPSGLVHNFAHIWAYR